MSPGHAASKRPRPSQQKGLCDARDCPWLDWDATARVAGRNRWSRMVDAAVPEIGATRRCGDGRGRRSQPDSQAPIGDRSAASMCRWSGSRAIWMLPSAVRRGQRGVHLNALSQTLRTVQVAALNSAASRAQWWHYQRAECRWHLLLAMIIPRMDTLTPELGAWRLAPGALGSWLWHVPGSRSRSTLQWR